MIKNFIKTSSVILLILASQNVAFAQSDNASKITTILPILLFNDSLFQSGELLTPANQVQLNTWIDTPNQEWAMCYKRSVNGDNAAAFHTACDNKGATVTVALLNEGLASERLIGGYAEADWSGSGYSGTSDNFLYSLSNNYKHSPTGSSSNYQYRSPSYGPTWGGGHDFQSNLATSSYCNIGNTYLCRTGSYGSTTCRNDFCGAYNPVISEVEVYYKKCNDCFIGTTLITQAQMTQLNSWTGTPNQNWILCYKKSTFSGGVGGFHANCDNKGPTITVAKLNEGLATERLIGGYAVASWFGSGYAGSSDNFLYSLSNNYKHSPTGTSSYYQYNNPGYGPTWGGGHDFYTNLETSNYCNIGHTYQCRTGSYASTTCRNDFCGTYNPVVSDLEVYYQQN